MAKKSILFLTVGGSPDPLIYTIDELKPDYIVFICSKKELGDASSIHQIPIIKKGISWGEFEEEILEVEPDDLDDCVAKISEKIGEVRDKNPEGELKANYTGGTKTMSAGLVVAALEERLLLYVTTGSRKDVIKISQVSSPQQLPLNHIFFNRIERECDEHLNLFNYRACEQVICDGLQRHPFPPDMRDELMRWKEIIIAFRLWDDYQLLDAYKILKPRKDEEKLREYALFLEEVLTEMARLSSPFARKLGESEPAIKWDRRLCKYAVVLDLLLSGQRCAKRERFDEATARLYRALEALAQLRLKVEYKIDSGDVSSEQLPESLKEKFARRDKGEKIKLGLRDCYELLDSKGDILGEEFGRYNMLRVLERRNMSVLAHGFQPIEKKEYEEMYELVRSFVESCLRAILGEHFLQPQQLPNSLAAIS